MLRVVLPSAADGATLPEPAWLANLHARKLLSATQIHIVCCGHVREEVGEVNGLFTEPDTQYFAA